MIQIHSAAHLPAGLSFPDVYFTPGYGVADAGSAAQWCLLTDRSGQWQVPLIVRDDEHGRDATSPYGYAGVFAGSDLGPEEQRALWDETLLALRDYGLVTVFLRTSPLVPQASPPDGAIEIVKDHPTFIQEITDLDAAWSFMEGRMRTAVRKARRSGLEAFVRVATPADFVAGNAFRRLYEATMDRRSAAEAYYFDDRYYAALTDGLGSAVWIGQVLAPGGECVAASIFLRHGALVHYHLSGAELSASRVGATPLLIWTAIEWASQQGCKHFHLGGGVRGRDSLHKFKRGFGGRELSFGAYGLVLDQVEYDELVERRAQALQIDGRALENMRYFPAYRATPREGE